MLKTTKIINDEFTKTADRYVFRIALPALLFSDLTENNVGSAFDGKYVLFCFSVTIFSIAVLWGLTEKFMKNEEQKGAFIQGSYRSSAAILGLAFINNMYDSVGMAPLMIIGCVPLYNIFACIILTLNGDNGGKKPNMKETFINVMKNPILLSILIALPFALLNLHFPSFVNKAIGSVANTATPLALISIGASFEGKKALKKMKPTLLASFIKLILLVGLFLPLAVLQSGDQLFTFDATGISTMAAQPELIYPTWGLFALTIVISLLALLTIFLFKKRILQIRICVFNAILMLGFYGLFAFFYWDLGNQKEIFSLSLKIAFSFPLISLILDYLAIRNIGADEALVRSLDRLR